LIVVETVHGSVAVVCPSINLGDLIQIELGANLIAMSVVRKELQERRANTKMVENKAEEVLVYQY